MQGNLSCCFFYFFFCFQTSHITVSQRRLLRKSDRFSRRARESGSCKGQVEHICLVFTCKCYPYPNVPNGSVTFRTCTKTSIFFRLCNYYNTVRGGRGGDTGKSFAKIEDFVSVAKVNHDEPSYKLVRLCHDYTISAFNIGSNFLYSLHLIITISLSSLLFLVRITWFLCFPVSNSMNIYICDYS